MKINTFHSTRIALLTCCTLLGLLTFSCKKDKAIDPTIPTFRGTKIDYNALTATTPYNNSYFVNSTGDSTVDRTEGHNRLKIIKAMDAYTKTASGSGTATLSATLLADMFANTNNPFTGTYLPLNSVSEQVKDVTATSKSIGTRDQVIDQFSSYFTDIATASLSVNNTASLGNAGKLAVTAPTSTSKYLVNDKGIEVGQVISKSLMGAFQLDYIGNVLLNTGLNADNSSEVPGKKYTALEHNWDVAYGILTLNSYYAMNATSTSSGESFLGSYVWEYNKTGYPQLHPAFLKGRAAIVNNDMDEVRAQAAIIRGIFEKAISSAAVGYLGKWTTGADDAVRAHALGEGLGFIYSTRFCSLNGADETFSSNIIDDLGVYNGNGFWDLTPTLVNTASNEIKAKFGL